MSGHCCTHHLRNRKLRVHVHDLQLLYRLFHARFDASLTSGVLLLFLKDGDRYSKQLKQYGMHVAESVY